MDTSLVGDDVAVSGPGRRLLGAARATLLRLPLAYLALFFFYPLLAICAASFLREGQLDLAALIRILTRPYYRERLLFTLGQAIVSTLLTLALALPAAQVLATFRFRSKGFFLALATLPFVLPTILVAAAFQSLLGDAGLLNQALMGMLGLSEPPLPFERSLFTILLVHVFYNLSIALHILSNHWRNQTQRLEEAARVLGCSPTRIWWELRLPLLRPALLSAGSLVFIFCFTSFGVVLLMGDVGHATLEVAVYRQLNIDLPTAATLSLTQSASLFLLALVYGGWGPARQQRVSAELQSATSRERPPRSRREWLWICTVLSGILLLVGAPLLALVWRSFRGANGAFTTAHYEGLAMLSGDSLLFVPAIHAIGNSLQFALMTTLLALSLGTLAAYWLHQGRSRRSWGFRDAILMSPLTTSAVTLGFGFTVVLASGAPNWFRALYLSAALIPILHTLVALPFVMRCLLPALGTITPNLREAAACLGANARQAWLWLELPLLSRGLLIGGIFAFVLSMGEFGASLFVIRPQKPTLPIVIHRLLGQPQPANYGMAIALSVLLLVICAGAFATLGLFRRWTPADWRW